MKLIGLTGGIASGKSTVSRILKEEYSLPIIDADDISRKVVEKGKPAYNRIVKQFGSEIVKDDGRIDRERLGQIVFGNAEKRKKLEGIIHPYIRAELVRQVCYWMIRGARTVIVDVPLLFEAKMNKFMHSNVVVYWYVTPVGPFDLIIFSLYFDWIANCQPLLIFQRRRYAASPVDVAGQVDQRSRRATHQCTNETV